MPEPLPNLLIMLALAAAPESVVLVVLLVVDPDVLLELLEVVVELAVDGVDDDTDVTMALTYSEFYRQLVVELEPKGPISLNT